MYSSIAHMQSSSVSSELSVGEVNIEAALNVQGQLKKKKKKDINLQDT